MKFEEYSKTFLHFHTMEVPAILRQHLGAVSGGALCDLGAGDGNLLISLQGAGLLDGLSRIVAVDLSEERCQRLRDYTDFTVVCGDATSVGSLESGTFDVVLCTQVIEHVDEAALLAEIRRLLKPNGMAYIASVIKKPHGWWYYRTASGQWALDPTHLREYETVEQYEAVIAAGNFTVVQTVTSPLQLSIIEFVLRRLVVPIFKPRQIHSLFARYPAADWVRRHLNIHPPGYHIVETIARRRD